MPHRRRIVILGNGAAAAHAVMAARQAGFAGEIHQVADVQGAAFNPMLAPYYLAGKLAWGQCFPFGQSFYRTFDVTCHFGSPVTSLDAMTKTIRFGKNRVLAYDRCLIATGARPVMPPVPGMERSGFAHPLRTVASMLRIQKAMASARKVIVLGASLVGVKLAEIFVRQKKQVILLDTAPQVFPRGAHPATAALIRKHLERHGIEIRLGCGLEGMEDSRDGTCCFLPGSIMEEVDWVAVCTGIKPNTAFVDPDQIAMAQAILVDRHMRTNAPDVYAAGDVCQGINRMTGKNEWLGTWAGACYQGRAAGFHMAGASIAFEGMIPQHISPIFDWVYAQMGDVAHVSESTRVEISGDPMGNAAYHLLVHDHDVLMGANLINAGSAMPAVKRALVRQSSWHPGDPLSPFIFQTPGMDKTGAAH